MLSVIELPFLPLMAYLAVFSSLHDVRFRRIPNRLLVEVLLCSIFINLILSLKFPLFLQFLFKFLAGFFTAFLLYYFDLWSAGDAKLYLVLSTLIFSPDPVEVFFPLAIFSILFILYSLVSSILKKKRVRIRLRKDIAYSSLAVLVPGRFSLVVAPLFFIVFSKYLRFIPAWLALIPPLIFKPKYVLAALAVGTVYDIFVEFMSSDEEFPSAPLISLAFLIFVLLF